MTVFAGYHLIRAIERAGGQNLPIVGRGVKLPISDFRRVNAQGRRYPLFSQVGTGTTDGFGYATYIGSYRGVGLRVRGRFRLTNEHACRNSLALSMAGYGSLFHRVPLGDK